MPEQDMYRFGFTPAPLPEKDPEPWRIELEEAMMRAGHVEILHQGSRGLWLESIPAKLIRWA